MTQNATDVLKLADGLFAAVEAGDAEAARAYYAPDATIWHNVDYKDQSVDECVRNFALLKRLLPDQKLKILRRQVTDDGFIQQDLLEATLPDGTPYRLSACLVVSVRDGLITRVEEYLDSAELQPLAAYV
ncbi:nuclear transport factor 2 family protein [Sphingomonas sp. RP10(2022)]|uniref:Nuclear transport factor 2 family protein n=1 Tax=Sphingomonas liriopis TaxID=2949094 RepID=A0A9X2HTD4_9SPHN|nr:nuclear transport factor 2 family protein [Sphingomonas liriopis]MCP3734016.1 nuclear transport factor 2 family protein [Sphingomonas liriopis]